MLQVRQNELRMITIHEETYIDYIDCHSAKRVRRWW